MRLGESERKLKSQYPLNPGMQKQRSYLKGTKDFLVWIEKLKSWIQKQDWKEVIEEESVDKKAKIRVLLYGVLTHNKF